MTPEDLPPGWARATMSDLARVDMGQSPDSRFYNEIGDGLPFFQGKAEFGALYPTARKWCSAPTKVAERDDILLSVRAPVGPTNVALERCCIGRGLAAVRAAEGVSQRYLLAFLRHLEPWLSQQGTGTTFTAISGGFLRSLELPLPPLAEQKRIADKLDTLLARVDACRQRLDRIPPLLKRFRQSVLAAATSGALTADWREEHEVNQADWRDTTFDAVCREITVGHVGKMADEYTPTGIPFLRSLNVRPFRLDPRDLKHISTAFHRVISKSTLRPGDVVVVRTGAPGQCCVIPADFGEANCSDLVIVRPGPALVGQFAVAVINSEMSQLFVRSEQVGVAQTHFNVGSMKRAPLQLPGPEEQHEIVRRVERLFAIADRLEASYTAARAHAERLTPAILAKAFRGELVPQDPNDEPASVLLERIRASRAAEAPKPRRGRQPRAREGAASTGRPSVPPPPEGAASRRQPDPDASLRRPPEGAGSTSPSHPPSAAGPGPEPRPRFEVIDPGDAPAASEPTGAATGIVGAE